MIWGVLFSERGSNRRVNFLSSETISRVLGSSFLDRGMVSSIWKETSSMLASKLCLILCLALGSPGLLSAAPKPDGKFRLARIRYSGGGDWYSNRTSLPNLLVQLETRAGLTTSREQDVVTLRDTDIFFYPLVYLNGHGNISFSPREVKTLRTYLDAGGFLWADDNFGMDTSFRRELAKVYPEKKLVELPFEHPIFHGKYDFLQGLPKIHEHAGGPPQALGIFDGGRLTVFYSFNTDIGDGLEDPLVHHDPPGSREQAMQMAINVVLFVLSH
jgi:hypothetical protein